MNAAWCGVQWGGVSSTSTPVTAPAARDHVAVPRATAAPGSRSQREITLPPPSTKSPFSEFLRKPGASPIAAHVAQLGVLVFDRRAAEMLGTKFPKSVLISFQDPPVNGKPARPPVNYIKYDAMIVACALRHGAKAVVSLDDKQRAMAEHVGLYAAVPQDFMGKQQHLPNFSQASPSPARPAPRQPKLKLAPPLPAK